MSGTEMTEADRRGPGTSRRAGLMNDGVLTGVVVEVLPRALYRVELESRERLTAHLSRDARRNFVRILMGDQVEVSRSPRDRSRGRITARRER